MNPCGAELSNDKKKTKKMTKKEMTVAMRLSAAIWIIRLKKAGHHQIVFFFVKIRFVCKSQQLI
jgi:hypothetical protein